MRPGVASALFGACAGAWFAFAAVASADDEPGSEDHALVGRYEGASIVYYKTSDFDEATLLQAPHDFTALLDRDAMGDRSGAEWLRLEGRVTKIRYEIPAGRSSLEVIRNYEGALTAHGFQIAFSCADQACFEGKLRDPYLLGQQLDTDNGDSSLYFDHARYLLAKLDRPDGPVYAGILAGEDKQRITAFVEVVESRGMEGDKIAFVDAGQMADAIAGQNSVNLYGITFDFDQAVLRPESRPTLDEIARLLNAKPELRLEIIGHTDNRGAPDYNLDLSRRRATSVAAALILEYGIAPERLSASGAGMTVPIASNDTPAGQARNRRVELVAR